MCVSTKWMAADVYIMHVCVRQEHKPDRWVFHPSRPVGVCFRTVTEEALWWNMAFVSPPVWTASMLGHQWAQYNINNNILSSYNGTENHWGVEPSSYRWNNKWTFHIALAQFGENLLPRFDTNAEMAKSSGKPGYTWCVTRKSLAFLVPVFHTSGLCFGEMMCLAHMCVVCIFFCSPHGGQFVLRFLSYLSRIEGDINNLLILFPSSVVYVFA